MDIAQAQARFIAHLSRTHFSPDTIERYNNYLGLFAAYMCAQEPTAAGDVAQVEYHSIAAFVDIDAAIHQRAASTEAGNVSRLRRFGAYLQRKERVRFQEQDNPFLALDRPRLAVSIPRAPEVDDVLAVLRGPSYLRHSKFSVSDSTRPYRVWMNQRNKIMLFTFTLFGVRLGELQGLYWRDINDSMRVTGKGRKTRFLPVPEQMSRLYVNFQQLEVTRGRGLADQPVFWAHRAGRETEPAGPAGKACIETTVRDIFGARCSGFTRVTPHLLRHAALTALAEDGTDATTLARIAGHSNINTTYTWYIEPRDARKRAALSGSKVNGVIF